MTKNSNNRKINLLSDSAGADQQKQRCKRQNSYSRIISGPIIIFGRQVEIQGTYFTKIKRMNSTPKKGGAALTTDIICIPAKPEVTKIKSDWRRNHTCFTSVSLDWSKPFLLGQGNQ